MRAAKQLALCAVVAIVGSAFVASAAWAKAPEFFKEGKALGENVTAARADRNICSNQCSGTKLRANR
jgi:hypothetical protein